MKIAPQDGEIVRGLAIVSREFTRGRTLLAGGDVESAHWTARPLDERVGWWVNRLGTVVAAAAALPGVSGRLTSRTGLQHAVGATGQGLVICAVGHEVGVLERAVQVKVMSEVIFGRDLALAQIDELIDGGPPDEPGSSADESKMQLVIRVSQRMRGVAALLAERPAPSGRLLRLGSNVPGLGVMSGFVSELDGMKLAAKQAVPAYRRCR